MAEFTNVLGNLVTGLLGVAAVVLGWRLKTATDTSDRAFASEKERREELKTLYAAVYVSLEQAIRQVRAREGFDLNKDVSEINARVHLLASKAVAEKYYEAASLFEEWSDLHELASPRTEKIGDKTVTYIQAPDPTAEYKKPAAEAYDRLQKCLEQLVETMRADLRDEA